MIESPCIFGEVLFDEFPDGRRVLGGAPFNVAWHLAAFGEQPQLISRVGKDADGETVRQAMQDWGMNVSGLQVDQELPTGCVRVHFEQGEPEYDIVFPSAWDAIHPPTKMHDCQLLYHGSLACRDAVPRETLDGLRANAGRSLFVDVNMRPPWWNRSGMLGAIKGAAWVKLNDDELQEMSNGDETTQRARNLIQQCDIENLLVTQGEQGARLFTHSGEEFRARPAGSTAVVDTVGAGDALASVMILGVLRRWPAQTSLDRAQAFASAIVGNRGATTADRAFYKPFIKQWV